MTLKTKFLLGTLPALCLESSAAFTLMPNDTRHAGVLDANLLGLSCFIETGDNPDGGGENDVKKDDPSPPAGTLQAQAENADSAPQTDANANAGGNDTDDTGEAKTAVGDPPGGTEQQS